MTSLVSKPATADLRDIRDWIAEDDPKRAVSYIEELDALFARIAIGPLIGRPREEIGRGMRSMVHRNHIVFSRPSGIDLETSRVLHGRTLLSSPRQTSAAVSRIGTSRPDSRRRLIDHRPGVTSTRHRRRRPVRKP